MRNIDANAVIAKRDKRYLENFIKDNEAFILGVASKAAGRYITKSDDHWSVSLSAFYEAVQSYTYEKGNFLTFSELVIRRRIIDYMKNQAKYGNELPADPYCFECSAFDEDTESDISREAIAKLSYNPDDSIRLEIEAVTKIFKDYGFSFFDLAKASPKAGKTKTACAKAVAFVIKNPVLLNELRLKKTLPIKIIEDKLKLPRKILERHRKYIIAAVEIISGDYPNLAEYLKFIREEL